MKPLTDRTFGLALAAVFVVIAGISWFFFDLLLFWAVFAAALFGLIAITVPWILLPLNRLWHALAYPLGQVMNYVVLGIFFFICMLPIGFIMRLFGRDPMRRTRGAEGASYWTDVQRHTSAETFPDMF